MLKKILLVLFVFLCVPSCSDYLDKDKHDFIDRSLELNRDDYSELTKKVEPIKRKKIKSQVPPISDVLIAPKPPEIGEGKLVSLSVTEEVPVKDIFIELARLADVDIEVDPSITGGIIFRAKNKPLNEVIKRVCKLAKVRYSMNDGILRVERDTPYMKNYKVSFLSMDRQGNSSVQVSTSIVSNSEDTNSSISSGSRASITSKVANDNWNSLSNGLSTILRSGSKKIVDGESEENFYITNKQAGIITVMANQSKHAQVESFISQIEKASSAQVLIEAKILEVTLDDVYKSGIKWGPLSNSNIQIDAEFGRIIGDDLVKFAVDEGLGLGIDALVEFTEKFGTSRTLSSPRLIALNNQQAVLTFAQNEVYFDLDVERETDTNNAVQTELFAVDSEVKTVPIGIILTIHPSINLETDEITLNVRPTLSRLAGKVEDPAVSFLFAQAKLENEDIEVIKNEIPVVEIREMDTVLKARNGQVLVIGGLMEERSVNVDTGVPFVSSIPFLGNAFKGVSKEKKTVEMVILLKATIVKNGNYVNPHDIKIYNKFSADPRPLMF